MGKTVSPVTTSFNRLLRIESRAERLTGNPGVIALRENLDRSGKSLKCGSVNDLSHIFSGEGSVG